MASRGKLLVELSKDILSDENEQKNQTKNEDCMLAQRKNVFTNKQNISPEKKEVINIKPDVNNLNHLKSDEEKENCMETEQCIKESNANLNNDNRVSDDTQEDKFEDKMVPVSINTTELDCHQENEESVMEYANFEAKQTGETKIIITRKKTQKNTAPAYCFSSSDSDIIDDTDSDPDFDVNSELRKPKRFKFLVNRKAISNAIQRRTDPTVLSKPSCSRDISLIPAQSIDDGARLNTEIIIPASSDSDSETGKTDSEINKPSRAKKRKARPEEWKKNKVKSKRNHGEQYQSTSKSQKVIEAKKVKPPCGDQCRLKCTNKISEDQRNSLFTKFWELGDVTRQRDFISKCLMNVEPKYRYTKGENSRRLNKAFYFTFGDSKIRVCKTFFTATLDIPFRFLRTVVEKVENGFLEQDLRGKHGNHKKLEPSIKDGVRKHINSIPRIESHFLRKQTTRQFIEGGKALIDLYRDYKEDCARENIPCASYATYSKIFNYEFNISFFQPKKDQCDLCSSYKLANEEEKLNMKKNHDLHLKEKELSRSEKEQDRKNIDRTHVVACYDLQAVFPVPKSEVSSFYYKSKLNCLNFTICELKALDAGSKLNNLQNEDSQTVHCYAWHEGEGLRGVNELGTCVFLFLKNKSEEINDPNLEIVLYSDNCGGQQKNKFMMNMYMYAVKVLNIKSITHKFLIRGHTQNEGDSAHSVIEKATKKALKSGPVYVPSQYFMIIRNAKKTGLPYQVQEMCHNDFYDLKQLYDDCGCKRTKSKKKSDGNVKGSKIKNKTLADNREELESNSTEDEDYMLSKAQIIKVEKDKPQMIFYKNSYSENEFKTETIALKRGFDTQKSVVCLQNCYDRKLEIAQRKKKDIMSLIEANLIPGYYREFYANL